MRTGFYSKIAVDNIRKNPRLYIPRILAESGLLGCLYILISLAADERLSDAIGGSYLPTFMMMGSIVLGLLSFVLILYINSFLMKQRKNEYGLYNVLGLEKKHVTKILFFESFFTSFLSIILGTVFGMLFYKLSSLVICKLLGKEAVAGFYYVTAKAILLPALIFVAFDFVAFVFNRFSIRRMKPIELLSNRHTGEKEPKIKWVLLVIGVLSLGAGYVIALTVKSPLEAIFLFFAAVILVIIGTYCLFITGTTFVLKCLRKNKKYYYNKKHMPAVSGLLFRMKQNAVGLASIAILSTCVLVMISTTVSLYCGVQDSMDTMYPQQLYLSAFTVKNDKISHISQDDLKSIVKVVAEENDVEIDNIQAQNFLSVSYLYRDGKFLTKTEVKNGWDTDEITNVMYLTEESYSQLTGTKITLENNKTFDLKSDEIAYCRISSAVNDALSTPKSIIVNGKEYKVKKDLEYFPINNSNGNVVRCIGIVVSDNDVLANIYDAQKRAYGKDASEYTARIGVEFKDESAAVKAGDKIVEGIFDMLRNKYLNDNDKELELETTLDTKWESKANMLEMYGTFLFLGILLGFVCIFSTILIIYYKQISEGYEDRERFQIMEKIGMEQKEVKKTIGSQLVLQFFMPLITAGIHISVAFPILLKLLKILMLSNSTMFLVCTLITFVVFSLMYTTVYLLTAKTYYKIVH